MEFLARYKRLTWTSLVTFLFLLLWLLWPDGRLDQVKAMQKELFSPDAKKLSPEERKSKFQALRQATEALSPAQKQQLAQEGQNKIQQDMERYVIMSKKEQADCLDKQIDRMANAQKSMQKKGGNAGGGTGSAKKNSPPLSNAEKDRARRQRLDNSTPEFRALMDRYRKDLQARMTARGMQGSPWMFGGRGP